MNGCDTHNQGGVWGAFPIIVLDVYEHAYFMDHGADRILEDILEKLQLDGSKRLIQTRSN